MKQLAFWLFAALALLLTAPACNRFHKASDFSVQTRGHQRIAILPFEVVTTGRMPKDMTPAKLSEIQAMESVIFQQIFFNKVHTVGQRNQRRLTVKIQPIEQTNSILKENGIGIVDSWTADPQKLADILGVDAVVRCNASKHRFMSDGTSFGLEVGSAAPQILTGVPIVGFWRTNDVRMTTQIYDKADGDVLFSGRDNVSVDWARTANDAIEQITRRTVRRFPYAE